MAHLFFTSQQLKIFAEDLLHTFLNNGFDVLQEPYIDYDLGGFRATYIRRYMLHKPTPSYDGILTTLVHLIGLPFGQCSQKMVIMANPRNVKNEQVCDTIKLRIHFDEAAGTYRVVHGDQQHQPGTSTKSGHSQSNTNPFTSPTTSTIKIQSNQQPDSSSLLISSLHQTTPSQKSPSELEFENELASYVAHILEAISPGLIELPFELKLEILKKLSVASIIKMSQVNNEFRALIFVHGESLWRHLCYRDFNIKTINRFVHKSWMELYRDTYIMHEIEVCRKERALPGLPERPALPPAPYRLQIGWLPEVLQIPFLPIEQPIDPVINERLNIALEWAPLRRAGSLDSLH